MLTKSEAYQRCEINRVNLQRMGLNWVVRLMEWAETDKRTYVTDDLEDAVLMGGKMRRMS